MKNLSTKELQGGVVGAYILMLIGTLSPVDSHKGSVVRVKARIIPILKKLPIEVAKIADEAYDVTKNRHEDEKIELDVGILIEALAFSKEEALKEVFGNDIITLISRATVKIQLDNLTKKQITDTYKIADELKKDLEKVIFEHKRIKND